jgi:hypothetical protein
MRRRVNRDKSADNHFIPVCNRDNYLRSVAKFSTLVLGFPDNMSACSGVLLAGVLMAFGAAAHAASSGTTILYRKGNAVSEDYAAREKWPDGVLELSQDTRRREITNSWFSGLPSDIVTFDFDLRAPQDVNEIITRFADIRSEELRVRLAAGGKRRAGITFTIGNQDTIDAWFAGLKMDSSGQRVFGDRRYDAAPKASPPTLTIYVDHEHVALERLKIPANTELTTKERWSWDPDLKKWEDPPAEVRDFAKHHVSAKQADRTKH